MTDTLPPDPPDSGGASAPSSGTRPPVPLQLVRSAPSRVDPPKSPELQALDAIRDMFHLRLSGVENDLGSIRKRLAIPSSEDTLPGVPSLIRPPPPDLKAPVAASATPLAPATPTVPAKLVKHGVAGVHWGLVLCGVLGIAAQLATIRYPRLVGPLQTLQQLANEAYGSHPQ